MTLGLGDLIDGGSYLPRPSRRACRAVSAARRSSGLYPDLGRDLRPDRGPVFFRYTRFGRYTAAVGSNAKATRAPASPSTGTSIKVYALAGLLAGVAAVLDLAIYTKRPPSRTNRQPRRDRRRRHRRHEPLRRCRQRPR